MEGGIEAGDLWKIGKLPGDGADGGEIVRLVQRRQWLELHQFGQHSLVEQDRAGIEQAAVDHPVAGGDDMDIVFVALQPLDQEAHPGRMVERSASGQPVLAQNLAVLVLADEVRRVPSPSIWPLPSSTGSTRAVAAIGGVLDAATSRR